ncbi:MAG: TIGR03086 family metal-binding protein [Acidimicrobiales bacterium]
MPFTDLEPAAQRMTDLIRAVPDDVLTSPTPCPAYTFGDLLDHVDGVALAFTAAAAKTTLGAAGQPPAGDASRLGADWRTRIPQRLATLTDAWRDPAARGGMTSAGGVEVPGEVAAIVALEELVIHGWDVARATDQPYDCDEPTLEVVRGLVAQFAGPDQAQLRGGAYGDPVVVDDAARLLDRVIGLSGRDPSWSPRPR